MRKLVTSTVSKPSFKCLANEEVTDRLYPRIMRVCVCVADLYEGEWDYTGQRVERNVCGRRPDAAGGVDGPAVAWRDVKIQLGRFVSV
jgi:hypothetical protein